MSTNGLEYMDMMLMLILCFDYVLCFNWIPLLGYLAQYAHQMFDGMIAEAKIQEERLAVIKSRATTLISVVKERGKTTIPHAGETGAESLVSETMISGFFSRDTLPFDIYQRYTSVAVGSIPDFSRIDAVCKQEGEALAAGAASSCTKNYSYPGKGC